MIKVYKIDRMRYTPFDSLFIEKDFNYLKSNGIEISETKSNSDIFIAYNQKT